MHQCWFLLLLLLFSFKTAVLLLCCAIVCSAYIVRFIYYCFSAVCLLVQYWGTKMFMPLIKFSRLVWVQCFWNKWHHNFLLKCISLLVFRNLNVHIFFVCKLYTPLPLLLIDFFSLFFLLCWIWKFCDVLLFNFLFCFDSFFSVCYISFGSSSASRPIVYIMVCDCKLLWRKLFQTALL
jgi:hypothetical protein